MWPFGNKKQKPTLPSLDSMKEYNLALKMNLLRDLQNSKKRITNFLSKFIQDQIPREQMVFSAENMSLNVSGIIITFVAPIQKRRAGSFSIISDINKNGNPELELRFLSQYGNLSEGLFERFELNNHQNGEYSKQDLEKAISWAELTMGSFLKKAYTKWT